MKRFIAHYMLAGGDGEQVRSDTIEGLWKFIESRISAVKSSSGGRSLCVGDTKSNSADWLWRMESGGTITYSHGKYGKIAALLFGGYSPAKDLRSIPSEKRSDASRTNGKKGGRPKLEPYSIEWKHARKAWVQDHHNEKWGKFWKVHYIMADTEYSAGEFLTKKEALDELKKTKANLK